MIPEDTNYPDGGAPDLTAIVAEYREIEKRREDVGPLGDDERAILARYSYVLRRNPDIAKICFPNGTSE